MALDLRRCHRNAQVLYKKHIKAAGEERAIALWR